MESMKIPSTNPGANGPWIDVRYVMSQHIKPNLFQRVLVSCWHSGFRMEITFVPACFKTGRQPFLSHRISGSCIQSGSSMPTASIPSPPFVSFPSSSANATLAFLILSSWAKICTPRTCVSFPFWWFSNTRTCTTNALSSALPPTPTPSRSTSTQPRGSSPRHS